VQAKIGMRVVVMLSCLWTLAATTVAQDADRQRVPEATFRAGTDLVALNVSAFDDQGQIINGLPKTAFRVLENGVQQDISVFRQEDVPVSLGLIIDVSGSMERKRERVVSSTLAMIQASNPEDEVCAIYFNESADLVQDFTSDIGLLARTLRNIHPQGGTAMRDAVLLGIDHLRGHARLDKRVLVVITDGEDNASLASQQRLVEAARRSNVIVYAIGLLGQEIPRSAVAARRSLEELTLETGGRSWFPYDVNEIATITPEIAHEIRNQYIVGYKPADPTKDGKWRAITVEVNVPGATVRTRPGYYARP
jgi:VWFA-related protein